MEIDHSKVYVTKQIGDRVECYNRAYTHIGTAGVEMLATMAAHHKVISEWSDWTGGLTNEQGVSLWWDTYER